MAALRTDCSAVPAAMPLVDTREASRLTGLSTQQLREWTSRRSLIPADVRPTGRGSQAQYSWPTILVLRIASVLRRTLNVELQAHRELLADLRLRLQRTSFLALWGRSLVIFGPADWEILNDLGALANDRDAIVVRLDAHLHVISAGFGLGSSRTPGQFELFPARNLSASRQREHPNREAGAAIGRGQGD